MAFGKRESYNDDLISYVESVDMLLHDLKSMGYENLTKEALNKILQNNFSIGSAVRKELDRILDINKMRIKSWRNLKCLMRVKDVLKL